MNNKDCCPDKSLIETSEGFEVCSNCGRIQRIQYEKEICYKQPVVYKKNNYMKKKLKKILINANSNESGDNIDKVIELFEKIGEIANKNNLLNKYSLNYNFTIYKIFERLNLDKSLIKLTTNPILIEKYNNIWDSISKEL